MVANRNNWPFSISLALIIAGAMLPVAQAAPCRIKDGEKGRNGLPIVYKRCTRRRPSDYPDDVYMEEVMEVFYAKRKPQTHSLSDRDIDLIITCDFNPTLSECEQLRRHDFPVLDRPRRPLQPPPRKPISSTTTTTTTNVIMRGTTTTTPRSHVPPPANSTTTASPPVLVFIPANTTTTTWASPVEPIYVPPPTTTTHRTPIPATTATTTTTTFASLPDIPAFDEDEDEDDYEEVDPTPPTTTAFTYPFFPTEPASEENKDLEKTDHDQDDYGSKDVDDDYYYRGEDQATEYEEKDPGAEEDRRATEDSGAGFINVGERFD